MSAPQPTMVPQLEDNVHKWQGRERSRSPGKVLNNDDKSKVRNTLLQILDRQTFS